MTISVLIPAYNCEATIEATLNSALQQTVKPDEILVMDDGSTDSTPSVLNSFKPHITVFRQNNKGLSSTRNTLVRRAKSELIAFLDSDDLWHPDYLKVQLGLFGRYPNAAGFFTGHVTFVGEENYTWNAALSEPNPKVEIMDSLSFIRRYAAAPGPFLPSFCCVPKRVLNDMGSKPFKLRIAEDLYFGNMLLLQGSIVYDARPLGGYRIRAGSLSSNRLRLTKHEVRAFEVLEYHYKRVSEANLYRAFREAFAIKRRLYAKTLMGAGRKREARAQLKSALSTSPNPLAIAKSCAWLLLSYLPATWQRKRPQVYRECIGSTNP